MATARVLRNWGLLIRQRLRGARKDAGLSQATLAADMRVRKETVAAIEQGRRRPGLMTVLLWCAACSIPSWVILEDLP